MESWTIATAQLKGRTLLAIPDRVRRAGAHADSFVTLEEKVGDEWLAALLRRLMPKDRPWAWWTRNEVFKNSKLEAKRGPDRVDAWATHEVLRRNVWTRQMSLCFVPANSDGAQRAVLEWSGVDTEQVPDHLWTAPDGQDEWDLDAITEWCSDARRWKDPACAIEQRAERIVTLFDGHVYCVLEQEAAARALQELSELARAWSVTVERGEASDAWILSPTV